MILINKNVVAVFSLMLSAGPAIADGLLPLSASTEPVWTDHPVRIDRAQQDFKRIPGRRDPYELKLRIRPGVKVQDGGSFTVNGEIFIVAKVIGMRPGKRFCRNDRGSIFACGGQSRAFLKRLITGRYLECKSRRLAQSTRLVECRIGKESLAERLVKSGFVRAVPGSGLSGIQARAVKRQAGIWADPACRGNPADC